MLLIKVPAFKTTRIREGRMAGVELKEVLHNSANHKRNITKIMTAHLFLFLLSQLTPHRQYIKWT